MPTLIPSTTTLKAKLFRGFSDVSRLSILEALRDGPLPVGSIVEKTGLSRTNVSNHLRCLADCDLVVAHYHLLGLGSGGASENRHMSNGEFHRGRFCGSLRGRDTAGAPPRSTAPARS